MADTKITALTALTAADPASDVLPIVDISDTTMAASGTTKKISINNILGSSGTATLASATITGDLTVRTNKLAVTNTGVGIGTATPIAPFDIRSNGNSAALFLRTTDPAAAVASAYIQAPVSTGFSSTVPVYGFWYQNSGMGNPAADTLNWIIASGEAMRLNSTGLGVGTAVQYARLTSSGSNSTGIANIQNSPFASNANTNLSCYIGHDGTANRPFIQAATGNAGNAFDLLIQPYGGNVGIGATPSGYRLHVRAAFASTVGGAFIESDEYNQKGLLVNCTSAALAANIVEFQREGTARLTLDASGNLILQSSATPATLATNGQLTVNATSNTNLRFSYRGSDGTTRVANITLA